MLYCHPDWFFFIRLSAIFRVEAAGINRLTQNKVRKSWWNSFVTVIQVNVHPSILNRSGLPFRSDCGLFQFDINNVDINKHLSALPKSNRWRNYRGECTGREGQSGWGRPVCCSDETNSSIKICWCCKSVCSVIRTETLPHRLRTVHVLDFTFSELLFYFLLCSNSFVGYKQKKTTLIKLIILLHFMLRFLVLSEKRLWYSCRGLHAQCTSGVGNLWLASQIWLFWWLHLALRHRLCSVSIPLLF